MSLDPDPKHDMDAFISYVFRNLWNDYAPQHIVVRMIVTAHNVSHFYVND
jgi:hypothetical protein